ncbi:MAG: hypothetical protein LBP55_10395, partial [Candidatus Adiutrix sp.]|nr:hypothetical protein [Candidatus Adiutrix sp.]
MRRNLFLSGFAALAFWLVSSVALAAPELFVVKDGEWFRQSGGQLTDPPVPNGNQETAAGRIFWLFADPEASDEAKGAEGGLYFYAEKTKKYSYLPFGAVNVNGVHFSPDGTMFIVESVGEGETNNITLELFSLADLVSHFKTQKAAMPPHWADAVRFVYSRFEPGTSHGKPADYPDEWMSLAVYDAASGQETVLKEATETSDFSMMGVG